VTSVQSGSEIEPTNGLPQHSRASPSTYSTDSRSRRLCLRAGGIRDVDMRSTLEASGAFATPGRTRRIPTCHAEKRTAESITRGVRVGLGVGGQGMTSSVVVDESPPVTWSDEVVRVALPVKHLAPRAGALPLQH
jgi:hypothetical protein